MTPGLTNFARLTGAFLLIGAISGARAADAQLRGRTLTYAIAVFNFGPGVADSVVINDLLPAGETFVSATPSVGTCTTPAVGSTGAVACSVGSLASGASASLTLVVTAVAKGRATLTNTASVNSATYDSLTANNTATVSTIVLGSRR